MKTNWTFEWTIAALLLIGAIAATTSASGQKSPSNPSGTELWLTTMDTDRDGTVSKQEFRAYMESQFDKEMPTVTGLRIETNWSNCERT